MDAVAEGARKHASKHQIQSESVENEQADAGREGQTCLARSNFQARTGTGKTIFPVQPTTSRIGNHTG